MMRILPSVASVPAMLLAAALTSACGTEELPLDPTSPDTDTGGGDGGGSAPADDTGGTSPGLDGGGGIPGTDTGPAPGDRDGGPAPGSDTGLPDRDGGPAPGSDTGLPDRDGGPAPGADAGTPDLDGGAAPTCSTPDPRGCAVLGCPDGETCMLSPLRVCRSSECLCDGESGAWSCTDDCLPWMACAPDPTPVPTDPPSACTTPNPAGCSVTGCPDGEVCEPTGAEGCRPSACTCDEDSGAWGCTRDCAPIMACTPATLPSTCDDPNPAGCPVTGCPPGEACVEIDADGCRPSACGCDAATGLWMCTADCQTMMVCTPDR